MTHPKVPRAHFAALDRALRSAEVFGTLVAVNLGTLGYPDLVAEIADLLLSYEGAKMVLCIGEYQHNAYLSLRTEVDNARAGAVMRHIVAHDGAAGGHGTMAGARLQATLATASELEATFREMVRRLAEALGIPGGSGEPLLKGSSDRDDDGWNDGCGRSARARRALHDSAYAHDAAARRAFAAGPRIPGETARSKAPGPSATGRPRRRRPCGTCESATEQQSTGRAAGRPSADGGGEP